jgi:uncharacterized protein YjiS (DUF1127 family)
MTHARSHSTDILNLLTRADTPVAARLAVQFAVLVTKWATTRRTRLALKQLEPWQLRDVGLTPGQASTEASRVFWQG